MLDGLEQTVRWINDDLTAFDIDYRNGDAGKRHHDRRSPLALDFEGVAGAKIVDRPNAAEMLSVAQHGVKPDQVCVVIFFFLGRRQRGARQIEVPPAQRFGLVAVVDIRKPSDQHTLGGTKQAQLQTSRSAFIDERSVAGDILGAGGKAFDADRTAHTVGAGDDTNADEPGQSLAPLLPP
jgi:hypothetical protein